MYKGKEDEQIEKEIAEGIYEDECIICNKKYKVTHDYYFFGYCPEHEGDIPAVLVWSN